MEISKNKSEISTRRGRPQANAKVYGMVTRKLIEQVIRECSASFTGDIEDYIDEIERMIERDNGESLFLWACEDAWASVQDAATEIFHGYGRPHVYAEGRSGGWALIDGLPDIDEWDAILLAKWQKFERTVRSIADDVPYQMVANAILRVETADIVTPSVKCPHCGGNL